jgi:hypothetical protein
VQVVLLVQIVVLMVLTQFLVVSQVLVVVVELITKPQQVYLAVLAVLLVKLVLPVVVLEQPIKATMVAMAMEQLEQTPTVLAVEGEQVPLAKTGLPHKAVMVEWELLQQFRVHQFSEAEVGAVRRTLAPQVMVETVVVAMVALVLVVLMEQLIQAEAQVGELPQVVQA